jgi:hypothetical protein
MSASCAVPPVVNGEIAATQQPTQHRRRESAVIGKPKQTETTQRWKVGLAARGRREPVRTRIEFQPTSGDERFLLEAVPGRVVAPYALRSPR